MKPAGPLPSVRSVALAVLVAAAATLAAGPRALEALRAFSGEPETCAFRERHGVDCLGCGGTRALADAARGRLRSAFGHNPIGAMAGILAWGAVLAAATSLASRRGRPMLVLFLAGVPLLAVTITWHAVAWWRSLPALE